MREERGTEEFNESIVSSLGCVSIVVLLRSEKSCSTVQVSFFPFMKAGERSKFSAFCHLHAFGVIFVLHKFLFSFALAFCFSKRFRFGANFTLLLPCISKEILSSKFTSSTRQGLPKRRANF